ncbi:helix-turn-helix domain-containing protein [Actinomycetospora lutea]|uniref:winged helix-turn-helix transcriptional regulator n=1 Tax=Actinomycetospora lutea TaxID=663604 RepID=UPI0023669D2C|nr:helix-turn-helix domain-containing protein [Actinomycetospora lutea]MDD7940447.1 helix-turn-helix domain-containing protein [Actinomycetospora lutea]
MLTQYCPIETAAEIVAERWNLLIVRDLLGPPRGFNDLHRCLPRCSRSMLAGRLRRLERAGLVTRTGHGSGRAVAYSLTEAGRELEPVLMALGEWSVRRLFADPAPEQLDPAMLAFRMSEKVRAARLPPDRTVVELRCRRPEARQWLLLEAAGSTACSHDPGHAVDVVVTGDTAELQRWFIGRRRFPDALADGTITIAGPRSIATEFPRWFDPATPWHATIARLAEEADQPHQSDSRTGDDRSAAPTVEA